LKKIDVGKIEIENEKEDNQEWQDLANIKKPEMF
jgi:hypothetical protein